MSESTPTAFDPDRIAKWLDHLPGATRGPVDFERLGAGQSNLTYRATDAEGNRVVVRRPPLGALQSSAHDVAREGRIMQALWGTDVPVPEILGIAEDADIADAPVVAMAEVPGVAITSDRHAEKFSPQARRAAAEGLIDAMVAIHNVDLNATGLNSLASHEPYAPRQLRRWSRQWERTRTRDSAALDSLTERLENTISAQDRTVLVHGDLHLGNLLCQPETGAVLAVVDWELSTLGDPLADVGSLLAYWPERDGLVLPGFAAALQEGFPTGQELAQRYIDATGCDGSALAYWHVLGLWKVAIIAEGVVRRVRDMPANAAPDGAPTVEMVDHLIAYAVGAADRAGL
ncbi:phosphotransferase family protein [Corynebacterium sp. TAE3-ERU12]|uniref:phosphotransferase family protein n=1 Tax=Corynebacterium sp. TAE3-ERU12 TaxID=2849491 RepID=UPI001C46D8F7|nr:phosphotransferase family protein [Corynebacterium sp. TAE3-ERU12]MBV7294874.1 phosphotransferase family protein [Corynebacterium sp. TAE3-ERU12]